MNATFNSSAVPLAGLIPGVLLLGYLVRWKWESISIVRVIIWVVWMLLLFGGLGLAAARIEVLPYAFAVVTFGALLLGILYLLLAPMTMDWWHRTVFIEVILMGITLLCFAIAGFSFIYNLVSISGISVFYFLPGMLAFLVSALFAKAYDLWMAIPPKKYKTWVYPLHQPVPQLQPVDPIRLVMHFTPTPSEKSGSFEGYEVEFPTNISVSELFHYFISFHNKHREYRKKPIQYMDGEKPLEWVLFKYSEEKKRVYLDVEKTLTENSIESNESIYALSLAY